MLKEQPFYNAPTEKPKTKHLNNVDMLSELPFYDELNIGKAEKACKRYARCYSIEIIKDKDGNMNDPLAQLKASKPFIKELSRDLLIEMKGFKYQITMKVLLRKQKEKDNLLLFVLNSKIVITLNNYGLNTFLTSFT